MEILTYSSLFPNGADPRHGIFVKRRLERLTQFSGARAAVVAPVPWFPFRSPIFGRYATYAACPRRERMGNIDVLHPRYPVIPKIGMMRVPSDMARFTRASVRDLVGRATRPIVLDAHYFFPDGVAAASLARSLGLPLVITARGSDINLIARMKGPGELVRRAAADAAAIVAVSEALADAMRDLGFPADRIHVIRNGVDLDRFQPGDRDAIRTRLGLDGTVFVSVGALKAAKGHQTAIEMLRCLPDATLAVIGSGEFETRLRSLVSGLGLDSRVIFTGALPTEQLLDYYRAADALVLASAREGMPNVVLESLACGTPVIASDVGGIREVVFEPHMGRLLSNGGPADFADAWKTLSESGIDRAAVRRSAESLSWDEPIGRLAGLLESCARRPQ